MFAPPEVHIATVFRRPYVPTTEAASLSQKETNGEASGHILPHASQPPNEMLDLGMYINVLTQTHLQRTEPVITHIHTISSLLSCLYFSQTGQHVSPSVQDDSAPAPF